MPRMGPTGDYGNQAGDSNNSGSYSDKSNTYSGKSNVFGTGSWSNVSKKWVSGGSQLPSQLPYGKATGFNGPSGGNAPNGINPIEVAPNGMSIMPFSYKHQLDRHNYDVKCCTINLVVKRDGRLVMGAGTARDFANKYKNVDFYFGQLIKRRANKKQIAVIKDEQLFGREWLVGIPTKIDWKEPSTLDLIYESMFYLVQFADMVGAQSILLPAPGCGNGGLDWESQVKPELLRIPGIDRRFHVCISKQVQQSK